VRRLRTDTAVDAAAPSLAVLLQPLGIDAFFADHWDSEPVHVTGPAGRFDAVMRAQDFERALHETKLSSPGLRFLNKAIGNRTESLDWFLRKKAAWTEPRTLSQLAIDLNKGTLVHVAIENAALSVRSFCQALFNDFRCPLSVNAYFSAGLDASAFDAHFDPQDTFILQLEGEKEWRLWERERATNPISGYPDPKAVPQPDLPADETILMTPGDLLYVPRGMWHWPRSLSDAPSLHLTLTVVMPRPVDVVQWLIEELSNDPAMRAALPMSPHQHGGSGPKPAITAALTAIAQKAASPFAANMAVAYMLRDATRTVMRDGPAPDDKDT
jgi:hypothetical protein